MENVVEQTELGIVEPFPDHGHSRGSAYHGQEEDGAVKGSACDLLVQKNCQDQSDDDTEGNLDQGIFNGVPEGLPCLSGSKDLGIVGKADKDIALSEVAGLAEGLIDRIEDRIEVQDKQADDGRRDEQICPSGFALFSLCHLFLHVCFSPVILTFV